ncbi:MAG: 5'-nucleotidase [Thermincolia bacterium]
MSYNLEEKLVVAITTRALFDLTFENAIFENEGEDAYSIYQIEHEEEILKPEAGFYIVKALLSLNELLPDKKIEVIIMSRNNPDTTLRIFKSVEIYELDITRAVITGGAALAPYLHAFKVDLFLSASEKDVQDAIDAGVAAGLIYISETNYDIEMNPIKIAFDGDAVIFSEESELIYKTKGIEAFLKHERENAKKPLSKGPFAKLLKTISMLQSQFNTGVDRPIRTALVTARNRPAHERVIRTLREWGVKVDEAFFLGGLSKHEVLKAFGAHIFFDDQDSYCLPASKMVPSARVPYKGNSPLKHLMSDMDKKIKTSSSYIVSNDSNDSTEVLR